MKILDKIYSYARLFKPIRKSKIYIVDQRMLKVLWFYRLNVVCEELVDTDTKCGKRVVIIPRYFFVNNINQDMDISSSANYPGCALSNFAPHPFKFRGFDIASMEGFLQGLKFKSPEMQAEVFKLVGRAAKKKGSGKNWRETQTLWWQGTPIKRNSPDYQELLDEAYEALYKNEKFRRALDATKGASLTHSIGKTKQNETVLTVREFCGRLTKLRDYGYIKQPTDKLF